MVFEPMRQHRGQRGLAHATHALQSRVLAGNGGPGRVRGGEFLFQFGQILIASGEMGRRRGKLMKQGERRLGRLVNMQFVRCVNILSCRHMLQINGPRSSGGFGGYFFGGELPGVCVASILPLAFTFSNSTPPPLELCA